VKCASACILRRECVRSAPAHSLARQRVVCFFSLRVLLVCAREEINLHHEIEMGKNPTVAATLSDNFPRLPPPCVCVVCVKTEIFIAASFTSESNLENRLRKNIKK